MAVLIVADIRGEYRLNGRSGQTVMQVLRRAGFPVRGECNGVLYCATCHVIVDEEWFARVGEAAEEEDEVLSVLPNREETSRLSCQIRITDQLDGLRLTLPD